MITLCQHCNLVLKVDLKAKGKLSHGICVDCNPGYLRSAGVPEEEINDFMEKYKKEDRK